MTSPGIGCEIDRPSPSGRVPRAQSLLGALVFQLCRGLARLLVRTFYRRVDVVGLEHVPLRGALLVAPTHPNDLVDSLTHLGDPAAPDGPGRRGAPWPRRSCRTGSPTPCATA